MLIRTDILFFSWLFLQQLERGCGGEERAAPYSYKKI